MVRVSDLMDWVPEENSARPSSLKDPRQLIVPGTRSISSLLRGGELPFGIGAGAFKKDWESLLAKNTWGGFGAASRQTSGLWSTATRTAFRALVERVVGSRAGFEVRVGRSLILPKSPWPKLPPEVIECLQALDALKHGDEHTFWRFVENQLGGPPDDLLRSVLNQYFLPHADHLPTWVFLRLLEHHRQRLNYKRPEKWYKWLADQVYERLKKNPNHRLMKSLGYYPESPHERLKSELPSAIAQAEREGFFGGYFGNPYSWHNKYMLGDVERQIIRTNRPLQESRNVSLDELVESGQELEGEGGMEEFVEEFARLEEERREQRRDMLSKGLSPAEQELLYFVRFTYNQEKHGDSLVRAAARYLDKAPSTVRVQIHHIKQYFAS